MDTLKTCFGAFYPKNKFSDPIVNPKNGSQRFQFITVPVQTVPLNRLTVRFAAVLLIQHAPTDSTEESTGVGNALALPRAAQLG